MDGFSPVFGACILLFAVVMTAVVLVIMFQGDAGSHRRKASRRVGIEDLSVIQELAARRRGSEEYDGEDHHS